MGNAPLGITFSQIIVMAGKVTCVCVLLSVVFFVCQYGIIFNDNVQHFYE
jgi:hypothetical protein